tara:strand:+ start:70 stop:423 length:354 start_codon:yes stop_codon:yes gene_type:complete
MDRTKLSFDAQFIPVDLEEEDLRKVVRDNHGKVVLLLSRKPDSTDGIYRFAQVFYDSRSNRTYGVRFVAARHEENKAKLGNEQYFHYDNIEGLMVGSGFLAFTKVFDRINLGRIKFS